MHIPDGFLTLPVAAATGVAAATAVGYAARRAGREMGESAVPVLGVSAAFIFAAQMLNFPVLAGTSGHFVGGLLACLVVGPWNGVVVMTAIVLLQALLMGDGGLTALGANVLNMAVVGGLLPWLLVRALGGSVRHTRTSYLAVAGVAAWLAVVLASATCAVELAVSGTAPVGAVLPAMVLVHSVIGIGEGLLTVGIIGVLLSSRPELLRGYPPPLSLSPSPAGFRKRAWGVAVTGLVVAVLLAVFVAPWASSQPDGLERVAETQAFTDRATDQVAAQTPLFDYQFPLLGDTPWSTSAAGAMGTVVLFGLVVLLGRALGRRASPDGAEIGHDGT